MTDLANWLDCQQGIGCDDTHQHCVDCDVIVDVERDGGKRCAYGCSQADVRCGRCALDHFDECHARVEGNRPSWEQVER